MKYELQIFLLLRSNSNTVDVDEMKYKYVHVMMYDFNEKNLFIQKQLGEGSVKIS